MTDLPTEPSVSAVRDAPRPPVAGRAAFESELDRLRARRRPRDHAGRLDCVFLPTAPWASWGSEVTDLAHPGSGLHHQRLDR